MAAVVYMATDAFWGASAECRTDRFTVWQSPTQTTADAVLQVSSGEIWGKAAKIGGMFPCVKAFPSNLPSGSRGIEFTTPIAPDPWRSSPSESRWYHPHTPGVMLRQKNSIDYAVITAVVVNLQP